jgi:Kef-type K+ transport system membrane component KefB
MTALSLAVTLAQEKSIAEEGRDIILVMLGVGLVFLGVIALGQFGRWMSHRRSRGH